MYIIIQKETNYTIIVKHLSNVCKITKISKNTLYKYFPNWYENNKYIVIKANESILKSNKGGNNNNNLKK